MNAPECVFLAFFTALVLGFELIWHTYPSSRKPSETIAHKPENKNYLEEYEKITPIVNFDWRSKEPLKLRTFKPTYHMTMGLMRSSPSELIEMDMNYLSRLDARKTIISQNFDTVIQAATKSVPAVNELYTWLTSVYLPKRFPSMFSLSGSTLLNLATGGQIPLQPDSDPRILLRILGENLDEEFVLLLPSSDGDGYTLKAYVTCFSSGHNAKEIFGLKLREIHKPVPSYKEKLEFSMDRFFNKLEAGRIVHRTNWTVTTHGDLFVPNGNSIHEGEALIQEEVDIQQTHLRCERHMLHRMPRTGAIVFSFKTYLYPIREIKEEGLGPSLAEAIDGLKGGNVPAMHYYKKGAVWGEAVKAYLRS